MNIPNALRIAIIRNALLEERPIAMCNILLSILPDHPEMTQDVLLEFADQLRTRAYDLSNRTINP